MEISTLAARSKTQSGFHPRSGPGEKTPAEAKAADPGMEEAKNVQNCRAPTGSHAVPDDDCPDRSRLPSGLMVGGVSPRASVAWHPCNMHANNQPYDKANQSL